MALTLASASMVVVKKTDRAKINSNLGANQNPYWVVFIKRNDYTRRCGFLGRFLGESAIILWDRKPDKRTGKFSVRV